MTLIILFKATDINKHVAGGFQDSLYQTEDSIINNIDTYFSGFCLSFTKIKTSKQFAGLHPKLHIHSLKRLLAAIEA